MKAHEITATATELLTGDRQRTHGDKAVNHGNIAALWSAYLARRTNPLAPLQDYEVAQMMVLLKVARTLAGVHNDDDYVDAVGYAAIAGDLSARTAVVGSGHV